MLAKTLPLEMLWTWPESTTLLPPPGRAVPSRWPATNFGTCHSPFSIFDSTTSASSPIDLAVIRRITTGTGVGIGVGGTGVAVGRGGGVAGAIGDAAAARGSGVAVG